MGRTAVSAGEDKHRPPVWSSHTNLVALALPSPQHPAPTLFPLAHDDDLFAALPPAPHRLAVQLTHLAGTAAAHPRVSTRLDLPLPPTFPADSARISHLSFAPDGSQLVVTVSAGDSHVGVDDLVTVFEQRSSCVDDWACVLQESVGRFGGARSASGGAGVSGKRVIATRWVGEPRRWYPAPSFPDAREQAKKPLYCAPPRSAPLSGTAFVVVLSSEEILFVHLPNASTSPVPPGAPTVLPSIVCLPLRPAPAPAPPPSSPESPSSPPAKGLTLPAVPTPPTPLPPLSSALFSAAPGAPLGAGAPPPAPPGTVETPTPQATIDALVTSLIPTLPANAALDPSSTSATTASSGPAAAVAGPSGGKSALQDELRLAASSTGARGSGAPGEGGLVREREVSRAAVGACRSRGGRAETVFVVAYCARAVGRRGGSGAGAASRRGSKVAVNGALKGDEGKDEQAQKEEEAAKVDSNDGFDDDFAMLADFTALDEAFGGGETAPAPKEEPAPEDTGASARELEEEKAELEAWARAFEGGDEADEDEQWRVELAEVRVEMAAVDGPRLTVRPQPPLFINPAPASSTDGDSDSPTPVSDPVLTHLTFLGDVSLPHPLQLTSHSPSLASDGSEPAVDLCLLAVVAHPCRQSSSSSTPPPQWRSTLSSYALSREDAYPLSDAFHTLEGRKLDAPNAVEHEGSWAARHVARRGVGKGEEGVLCAIEIRPGGGEWASVSGVVAEPVGGGEGTRTRVLRLSSVTLEPLDKTADGAEDESVGLGLPGGQLFSALTTSPNGALICAIPFSTSSSTSSPPVLAAAPLGRRDDLPHKLATRLAIGIARQGDVGDLVGRVRGLGDAEATLSVVQRAHEILRAMVPADAQLDASALGLELLGVTTSLFRNVPELQERAEAAEKMLELAACARALKRAEKRERGAMAGAWKPDLDAIWPVVGHCVWFCSDFLSTLLASAVSSPSSPAVVLFLHPLYRGLLSTVTSTLQHLSAYLTIEGVGSEAMDLARGIVEDALAGVGRGRGLVEWGKLLAQVNSELDGGPAVATLSPPLLASLAVPPSLEAQATAVRNLILAAFPPRSGDKTTKGESGAPPTPPRTPLPSPDWDAVRRARLPAHGRGCRSCLRCGRRTLAFDEPVVVPVVAGVSVGEGRWKRFEAEWEGRCVCGGMWTRVRLEGGQ
ncbi:uncharacterized protein RHOBADRAFT_53113 [Rhodotorula graminis WP1]|uniref:Mediator complex subunit 16 C-terminal domain-containing protein n=1 Tax=Rhodotorula graminis (strain WP1) TaxID=578459 RepID=A0A194S6K9_RHOGW|nr:uncharacterized protein RHOBADRAFT_53113 [Rhodotorula graminis WP1]KPV76130.1 hypothetical protein RHOBADRAFT_53113 [Rhodotorula graminis WP1]